LPTRLSGWGLEPVVLGRGSFANLEGRLRAKGGSLFLIVEQYATRALAVAGLRVIGQRGTVAFVGDRSNAADEELFAEYVGSTTWSGTGGKWSV